MGTPSALAADLALLTDALDIDGVDIASTVALLTGAVTSAVPSHLGLSLRVRSPDGDLELTTLPKEDTSAPVATSLRFHSATRTGRSGPSVVVVIYAGLPGAFVDLAADLAWLTGSDLGEIGLDLDLGDHVHLHPATPLRARSRIDQAIGVLVGGGRAPEEALTELAVRALRAGTDRHGAAVALLDALAPPGGVLSAGMA